MDDDMTYNFYMLKFLGSIVQVNGSSMDDMKNMILIR